jgi:hypothetical protein
LLSNLSGAAPQQTVDVPPSFWNTESIMPTPTPIATNPTDAALMAGSGACACVQAGRKSKKQSLT